jgi:alpha-L-arabinofuranosidase
MSSSARTPCRAAEPGETRSSSARVRVDARDIKFTISKQLTGSHFVYAFESDSLYRDERIAAWMRRSKVGVIRWPGGTAVQSYHWDKLNGIAFKADSWDPKYKSAARKPSEYMDLDEYITYCRRVGAEAMVGINIKSGKLYNRKADSLDEARRLIEYCRKKKYRVKYWYIGNECYIGFGHKTYAAYIDTFAKVLKSVDPEIEIVADWKFGPQAKRRFTQCLEIVKKSRHIDIMEIHEKWGNSWGLASGKTLAAWRKQFPIYDGKLGQLIRQFHKELADTERSGVKLAFNEWGLGRVVDGDEFDHALIAADFMIELFRSRVHQACYWNLNMGHKRTRVLVTAREGGELKSLNPVAHVFEMYAHALGTQLLAMTSSRRDVYGFAARDAATKTVHVYLLNKNSSPTPVEIDITGLPAGRRTVQLEAFIRPGKLVTSKPINTSTPLRSKFNLDPFSFNRITVGLASPAPNRTAANNGSRRAPAIRSR